jgi:hypothetical protein
MADLAVLRGSCHLLQAFDVGFEIDLRKAMAALSEPGRTRTYFRKSRLPLAEQTLGQAVRSLRSCEAFRLGGFETGPEVELTIYRFGVISLTFSVPFEGPAEDLRGLAVAAYDSSELKAFAAARVEEALRDLGDAVSQPRLSTVHEDYRLFVLEPAGGATVAALEAAPDLLAGVLRAEVGPLAADEVSDALKERASYSPQEAVWVDWLSAVLVGEDMDEECDVLELATAELTAMRFLDAQLQESLEASYGVLERAGTGLGRLRLRSGELQRAARLQADHALLREIADNPLKLHGDDYLARIYDAASRRFRFDARDSAVERKLATLRDIYQQVLDLAGVFRSEALEWIIIILIAVDILVYFTP